MLLLPRHTAGRRRLAGQSRHATEALHAYKSRKSNGHCRQRQFQRTCRKRAGADSAPAILPQPAAQHYRHAINAKYPPLPRNHPGRRAPAQARQLPAPAVRAAAPPAARQGRPRPPPRRARGRRPPRCRRAPRARPAPAPSRPRPGTCGPRRQGSTQGSLSQPRGALVTGKLRASRHRVRSRKHRSCSARSTPQYMRKAVRACSSMVHPAHCQSPPLRRGAGGSTERRGRRRSLARTRCG